MFDDFDYGAFFNPADLSVEMFNIVMWVVLVVFLLVARYIYKGLMIRKIGRKAGLEKDWMVFVPFARPIYRLQIVREKWWKMFFLEYAILYFVIIRWFFGLFDNDTMRRFGDVIGFLYVLGMLAYNIYYRTKFYKAFGIKSDLALGIVTLRGFISRTRTVDSLIAFTDLFQFGGTTEPRSLTQVMRQEPMSNANVNMQRVGAQPSLSGVAGMYAGQSLPLAANEDMVIGRDASLSNIIIDQNSDKVSRRHCIVRFDTARNTYMVTDSSTNGTFIDGGNRLVANVPTPVQRGSVISLGSRENQFRLN